MGIEHTRLGRALLVAASISISGVVLAADSGRQIEEVIVTAERKAATVQDTSISITAFTTEMLDDFGIRNQSDLQNMVPATTIQPYDSAIRGVGRNFRNLGGDPGVATYLNGVYFEDLYSVTIGSFWDMDRIEVLRGPQGTLYGRNAVGGAMNFHYQKPTDEVEFSAKTILGDYDTKDFYAVLSGPLIKDRLNGRITASSRQHDGWIEDHGLGPDLDSGDEQNIAVQLEWKINDNMHLHVRSNQANVDRVMGGADGAGLIVLTGENTAPGGDHLRNYTRERHTLRNVDPGVTDPTNQLFVDPTQRIITYTNPATGAPILAQYARPGVDNSSQRPNFGLGSTLDPSECVYLDRDDIDGDDLCAFTNGLNNETFDQQGNQLEFVWDINDGLVFKYIFGYNDLMYERDTDDDNTASTLVDRTFYVNHEATYASHELQLFWDVGDNLTFTSGVFFYSAVIDQRYDFYDATGSDRYTDPTHALDNILATVAPGLIPGDPSLTFLFGPTPATRTSARDAAREAGIVYGEMTLAAGSWIGEPTYGLLPNGNPTIGTDLIMSNKTERDSFAAYTQGVWNINDKFTLTAGLRYAEDEVFGTEYYSQYAESMTVLDAFGLDLVTANIIRGAIDPATLQPTGATHLWYDGTPITFGLHRANERTDDQTTIRLNLDYNITEDTMIYGNVTTGYRGGGFNLAFFSQTPEYEPEELTAYELGYKSQFLDNTLQLFASVFFYDYESIHTFTEEACPIPETPQSAQSSCAVVKSTASVQAAPGAEVTGLEIEAMWLPTDRLTLGGIFSYTDAEYSDSFIIVDGADPSTPGGIYDEFNNADRRRDVKGKRLPQIPEYKANLYAMYAIPMGGNGSVDLIGNWSYTDDVYFAAFKSDFDLAPSYQRLDLRATWTSATDSWIVSGFVNNVFDEIGIRQILREGESEGYRRTAQVTEPRMYGIEVTYNMQ